MESKIGRWNIRERWTFVQNRSLFLSEELSELELKKQRFKENNNLTDIKADAGLNAEQKIMYDSELFSYYSQLDLLEILISELENLIMI